MSLYHYNNQDIVVTNLHNGYFKISVNLYHHRLKENEHGHRPISSVSNWEWTTNCLELVTKLGTKRTKVFDSQLVALTKQFGFKQTKKNL